MKEVIELLDEITDVLKKKNDEIRLWKNRYDEMIETCALTARQRDEAMDSLAVVKQKLRPDSEGWWWRLYRGKNGDEWTIGEAKMIYWEDAGEPVQERVLAWSAGGCQTRCDYINMRTDSGTRWFKQLPPVRHNSKLSQPNRE